MSAAEQQVIAGKYRLERCLARGGMGSVWLARHLDLDVNVAVKLLRDGPGDSQQHQRFRREAQAAARLRSPHVVSILDFGIADELPYLAMEYLQGEDLALLLDRVGRLPPDEAWPLIEQAGAGLQSAHAENLIHRDIKPANLFVEDREGALLLKILDFGIARDTAPDSSLTTEGITWGSPAFMSPEQARGRPLDARSDLWSLAAVVYRMLTGQSAHSGSAAGDIVVRICTEPVTPPSELVSTLPPGLDHFFARAFSVDPEGRFASVDEFLDACAEALGEERSRPSLVGRSALSHAATSTASSARVGRIDETAPLDATVSPGETAPLDATTSPDETAPLGETASSTTVPPSAAPTRASTFSTTGSTGEKSRPLTWWLWATVATLTLGLLVRWLTMGSTDSSTAPLASDTASSSTEQMDSMAHRPPDSIAHESPDSMARKPADSTGGSETASTTPPSSPAGNETSAGTIPSSTANAASAPGPRELRAPARSTDARDTSPKTEDAPTPEEAPPTDPLFGLPVEQDAP